jgi:hypothetical protein
LPGHIGDRGVRYLFIVIFLTYYRTDPGNNLQKYV